ncbi:MAG: nucleoside-diphosphate sugar epimerase/dehydratase [Candidatus Pacebacteria bacterium]|nr:nucleoside-diphosphate sugar epimerase/dehydratase [Candidatus Paceibacterota bacterium]
MLPKRKFLFLIADIVLIVAAIYLSFLLRFDGKIPPQHIPNILGMTILAIIFLIPTFYFSKLYFFSWTYVSTEELISLAKATALSFLFLGASFFVLKDRPFFYGFPRSVFFISYFLIFFFCGGLRFSKRIYLQLFRGDEFKKSERTLIVGAGDAGEHILRNILNSHQNSFFPIGFVDDNPVKQKMIIHGLKVFGKINDIPEIVRSERIKSMIIALPSAGTKVIKRAVELGRKAQLKKIKIVPPLNEIIGGKITIGNLREVEGEDLLGRDEVELELKSIENFINSKTILVTGAAGSIGSELCRQIAKFNPGKILMLDQDETGIFNISEEMQDNFPEIKAIPIVGDISDEKKIEQVFNQFSPNLIFHAAAYKHVPLMEVEPEEAVKNNIFGTKKIAEAAVKYKIEKFVFISTDKAVRPVSVMGATKRIGEMICQVFNKKNSTKFVSVRFGNVLDSRGSVIPIFREQIKKGGPVEITHPDMKRYFMTTSEACLLLLQASAMSEGGEVFVLDMGKPIRILDLAREMIKLSGLEPDKDIPIVFTKPRPGEKLFEEILTAEEGVLATKNQKIFVAKLSNANEEKLNSGLQKLNEAAISVDRKAIIKLMSEIIPSYSPSVY